MATTPKDLLKHPLVAIVVGVLVTGFGKDVLLALLGILICAAWLCWDLSPWTTLLSVTFANRYRTYANHFGAYGKGEAEWKRQKLREAGQSIILTTMCLLILGLMYFADRHVITTAIQGYKDDTYKEMIGSLTFPEGGSRNNTKFSVTNNSSHRITLVNMKCTTNHVLFDFGNEISSGDTTFVFNVPLHPGGDTQSENCPTENHVYRMGHRPIICGDLSWKIQYVLDEDSTDIQTKEYRYVLNRGENAWSGVATSSAIKKCI